MRLLMVSFLKLTSDTLCYDCSSRLLMPDGGVWCGLKMEVLSEEIITECLGYEKGIYKVYLLKQERVQQRVVKKTVQKSKPIIPRILTKSSSKKSSLGQQNLF